MEVAKKEAGEKLRDNVMPKYIKTVLALAHELTDTENKGTER